MEGVAMRGLLITFEGQDGSGKSTLLKYVAGRLAQKGIHVLVVQEFSSNVIGKFLKRLLKKNKFLRLSTTGPSAITETIYVLSDLYSQNELEIEPALQQGLIVMKERYVDSILACQIPKIIDDYPFSDVNQLFQWITNASLCLNKPNLTFFLQVKKKILEKRILARGERISESDFVIFKKRQAIYDRLAVENQNRWVILSNDGDPSEVAETIVKRIFDKLCYR